MSTLIKGDHFTSSVVLLSCGLYLFKCCTETASCCANQPVQKTALASIPKVQTIRIEKKSFTLSYFPLLNTSLNLKINKHKYYWIKFRVSFQGRKKNPPSLWQPAAAQVSSQAILAVNTLLLPRIDIISCDSTVGRAIICSFFPCFLTFN